MSTTSALPFRLDIKAHKEASTSRKIIWRKASDGTPAVDLTAFDGKMTIKPIAPSTGAAVTLTTQNGGLIFDAVEGSVTIILTPTHLNGMTQPVNVTKYGEYDLLLIPKVGTVPVYALVYGQINLIKAITQV